VAEGVPGLRPVREAHARLAPEEAQVSLARFDTFRHHRDSYTVWLKPEPEETLIALQRAVWSACWEGEAPRPTRGRFRPHLSVGQARGRPAMIRLLDGLRR
jgi:2'-5' RNA ligase